MDIDMSAHQQANTCPDKNCTPAPTFFFAKNNYIFTITEFANSAYKKRGDLYK
jgi:hypothetical protein